MVIVQYVTRSPEMPVDGLGGKSASNVFIHLPT